MNPNPPHDRTPSGAHRTDSRENREHMGGLLDGKTILVTGIITDASIAFHAAAIAQEVRTLARDARVETLGDSVPGSAEGQNTE